MAYNTKTILKDASGNPIPQIWNPMTDQFEPYEGVVKIDGVSTSQNQEDVLTDLGVLKADLESVKAALEGTLNTKLAGSNMERYGATINERPDVNTVPTGAVYMAVNSGEIWQSNGSEWVVRL